MSGLPRVLLAGNPNTGKSTLFNRLTGGRARIGNYPGITVEPLIGRVLLEGAAIELQDLPGTYSLVAHSLEEQLAIDALTGRAEHPRPELVLVCCDATNLLRNLYLLLQIQELGLDVVLVLTMTDEAGASTPDPAALGEALECSVVACNPRRGEGLEALRETLVHALEHGERRRRQRWQPGEELDALLEELAPHFEGDRVRASGR